MFSWFSEEWNRCTSCGENLLCLCTCKCFITFLFLCETWTRLRNSWSALCSLLHNSHLFLRRPVPLRTVQRGCCDDSALLESGSSVHFSEFVLLKAKQIHTPLFTVLLHLFFNSESFRVPRSTVLHSLFYEVLLHSLHCGPKYNQPQHWAHDNGFHASSSSFLLMTPFPVCPTNLKAPHYCLLSFYKLHIFFVVFLLYKS